MTTPDLTAFACQLCGTHYPAKYLFDLKGTVPGGCKVTCLECRGRLDEREACARLCDSMEGGDECADAIRARTKQ